MYNINIYTINHFFCGKPKLYAILGDFLDNYKEVTSYQHCNRAGFFWLNAIQVSSDFAAIQYNFLPLFECRFRWGIELQTKSKRAKNVWAHSPVIGQSLNKLLINNFFNIFFVKTVSLCGDLAGDLNAGLRKNNSYPRRCPAQVIGKYIGKSAKDRGCLSRW